MKNPKKNKKLREYILPTAIAVGYQKITVEEVSAIDDTQGSYTNETHEIKIKSGMNASETLNTMLHEMLHAIIYTYGLKDFFSDDDKEEKFVNVISNGMTEALVRNPDLVKFIVKSV